jgi:hypothetical protein
MRRAFFLALAFLPAVANAQALTDRVSAGGYFRLMARPDFMGGNGNLGFWNLYGRLMNEGPWASLELKLDLLQSRPGSSDTWASVYAKIEGGSVGAMDPNNGSLAVFRLSQLYARAGNVLFDDVVWQLGTIDYYFGGLGLYDLRMAEIFEDTIGLSAQLQKEHFELLIGVGDSGFGVRGLKYVPLITAGGVAKFKVKHFEIAVGGQVAYEPFIAGSKNSSYVTPGVEYEDFKRREVVSRFLQANPGQESLFPDPVPASKPSISYRVIGNIGFGDLGPLVWNNAFVRLQKVHPELSYSELVNGREWQIYSADLTRERYRFAVGDELQLRIIRERLDLVLAGIYGQDRDFQNTIAAGYDNMEWMSAVLRLQGYFTKYLHALVETSIARERSLNGNLFREHFDSIFQNAKGVTDSRGLEYGDASARTTWQLKLGPVLNPGGWGIFSRPSLRLLYGVQYSTMQNAFGNAFVDSLNQFNNFPSVERHWHHLVSLEAEAWF